MFKSSFRNKLKNFAPLTGAIYLAGLLKNQTGLRERAIVREPSFVRRRVGAQVSRRFLSACVRVKDEGDFIVEWICHHLARGIEHFYVYDNGSVDRTSALLAPFVNDGLVTHIGWPHRPASPSCYQHLKSAFAGEIDWVAFFDADEFLVAEADGGVLEVLRRLEAPALALNWRYFGSSGYESLPEGLLTERFTRCDLTLNRHVKVIAKLEQISGFRNSHNFFYAGCRLARTIDGRRVFGSFVRPADRPLAYLNHYVYRSRDDYEKKLNRGFVDQSGAAHRDRNVGRLDSEFSRHNEATSEFEPAAIRRTRLLLDRYLGEQHSGSNRSYVVNAAAL